MSGVAKSINKVVNPGSSLISGALFPSAPSFNQGASLSAQEQAAQLQQRYGIYGVNSPLGGVQLVQNPDGTYTQQFTQSAADEQRNALIGQGLSGLSLDPTQAQQAYYEQATRQLLPQFERQQEALDASLINRGIGVGTEQYERAIENLRSQQAGTLSDIQNQAVFQGQNLLGQQIGNIGALTGQRDIGALAALRSPTGTSFQETYTPAFQNQQQQFGNQQQQFAQLAQLGALAFSDERLKENLVKVGKLDNGLNIYIGNYKEETGLDTKSQLFLIAQEVQKVKPEAVREVNGFLAVDYMEAVK